MAFSHLKRFNPSLVDD